MNKPVVIYPPLHTDDRGHVYCALDNMDGLGIKRTYVVENFQRGQIRAWHGHRDAHTYMHVIRGACKLLALPMDAPLDGSEEPVIKVLTERSPAIFWVPAGYYNGAESLTDGTKILVYSTLSFNEVKNDDHRLQWDKTPNVWGIKNR